MASGSAKGHLAGQLPEVIIGRRHGLNAVVPEELSCCSHRRFHGRRKCIVRRPARQTVSEAPSIRPTWVGAPSPAPWAGRGRGWAGRGKRTWGSGGHRSNAYTPAAGAHQGISYTSPPLQTGQLPPCTWSQIIYASRIVGT